MNKNIIKTRYAPSPTGYLHVGGLRTALYCYLVAKKNAGNFILRIEDTDRERFVPGAIENLIRSLNWAGINSDEGVVLSQNGENVEQVGQNGPYIQSEKLETYQKYANQLIEEKKAYYCFCSKERLEELRKIQEVNKQPPGYDGHCRNLSLEEAKLRIANGEKYVIRMKMPKEGTTKFTDLIRGEVEFRNELVDDQVILKTDGFPTYHLAVVIDDHFMEITHAIRGEEWLSSTPKHLVLYDMFGWQPPQFAHLPLLLNADKSKLSKRQGDVAVEDYRNKGYLPEAVINFVAFLGWNPGTEKEIFSLDELVQEFSLERVSKSGAVFNLEKLDWYNKEYLKMIDENRLLDLCKPLLEEKYKISNSQFSISKIIALERERATTLVELAENLRFIFEDLPYESEILVWKKDTRDGTKNKLQELYNYLSNFSVQDWTKKKMEQKVGEWIKEKNYGVGDVLWPMRVALSGQKNSPGPYEIAEVLGKEKSLERMQVGIKKL